MEIAAAILLEEDGRPLASNSLGSHLLQSEEWSRLESRLQQRVLSARAPVILAECSGQGPLPYIIWSTPLKDCLTQPNGRSLCCIFDLNRQAEVSAAVLREAFRLTRAEVRLSEQVLLGKTPAEAAEVLGVTIHTVRTYLKRLYQKTGAKSQATLVRKLLQASLVPVIAP